MFVKRFLASAVVSAALASGGVAARADVLYAAPEAYQFGNNVIGFAPCCGAAPGGTLTGAFGVGNTITFADPWNVIGAVDLYGYAGGGSKPIEVDIYSGANPNTGSLLGSAQATPTGDGWTTEVLDFHGLLAPGTVTFIVSIVGNGGSYDDSFVNWQQFTGVTGSPTVGAAGDMWYGAPGSYVADNSYAIDTGAETNTLAVQFIGAEALATTLTVSAPEPSTWAMMGLGFAALGFAAFRRTRATRSLA